MGPGAPVYRHLRTGFIGEVEQQEDGVRLTLEVTVASRNAAPEWAQFHNVTLVGYTEDREVVCERSLGTLKSAMQREVTVKCSRRPDYLTFRADESPCDDDTRIGVTIFDDVNPEQNFQSATRSCDGPDLPTPNPTEYE